MKPVDINDPSRFEQVPFGSLPHPDAVKRNEQGGASNPRVESPEDFLSKATQAPFAPPPLPQTAATTETKTKDPLQGSAPRVQRSAGMQRLLRAYGIQQVQNVDLDLGDGVTVVLRALNKEDFSWAQHKTRQFGLTDLVANEGIYMIAIAACAVAAIRIKDEQGNWNTEPTPVALGLLSEQQMSLFRDPLYPSHSVRRLCADDLFAMFMGISGNREENLLASLGETIAIGWEEKIGQKIQDLSDPLDRLQSALTQKTPPTGENTTNTTSNSEAK